MALPFRSVAIIGTGALGMYYGIRLGLAGAEVKFLLRSDLEEVRQRGAMAINDGKERFELRPVAVFGSTEEMGAVDLVVITLKTTANRFLPELLPPLIGPNTAVLTLQNGIGPDEIIGSIVGPERVLGALAFIAATRTGPGEVIVFTHGSVVIGEFGRPPSDRLRALVEQFKLAAVKTSAAENLAEARWRKLVWNIPFNGLAIAAGGLTTDIICDDPVLAARVRILMKEVQTAAARLGYLIPDEFLRQQFEVTPPMGSYQPSSLVDFVAGREVEIESIWGEPLRRAQAAGAEMPELARLYDQLRSLL